jgi:exopolysaccharide production protein ExoQ
MYTISLTKSHEKPYTNKVISILLGEVQLFVLIFPFLDFYVTFGKWINLTGLTNLVTTSLAGISIFYLILRKRLEISLSNSILLFSFIAYLLVSLYWVHPLMVSDSRSFTIRTLLAIIQTLVIVQVFAERGKDELLDVLKRFAIIITILSFLSIVFFPSESSWTIDDTGRKQGFYSSPNNLGQFLAFAFLIINFYKTKQLHIGWLLLLDALILYQVNACDSKTSLTGVIICFCCYYFRFLLKPLFYVVIVVGISLPLYTNITQQSKNVQKIDFANRDLSFTGRSDVWDIIITDMQKNHKEIFGFGSGGYWGEQVNDPKSTINELDWEPHQGHNGYLDIRLMGGLVGFIIFLLILLHFINTLFKNTSYENVVIIFISLIILINNITESSLFRGKHFYFILFMLIYWFINQPRSDKLAKPINFN